jgi:DNA-binding transcriptional LysR family regulator
MDLWQLNIYCKVVEQRSFSKAGKLAHLSQPTVSSHIKDLENHFGCRLIDRLAKEAVPTKEGELLYRYARRLIGLRDETEDALRRFKDSVEGNLLVGGSTIPGGYLLPQLIAGFLKKYPKVFVSLQIGGTGKVIADILSGKIELGVVGARISDHHLEQKVLLEDEMRLVVPRDHKWSNRGSIDLEMLLREPFIVRESGSGTLKSLEHNLQKSGHTFKHFNIVSELGSTESVVQGIKNMIGLSIVSPIAVADELNAGSLKALQIKGLNLKRYFYFTRHKHRSPSPPGEAFLTYLTKVLSSGNSREPTFKKSV